MWHHADIKFPYLFRRAFRVGIHQLVDESDIEIWYLFKETVYPFVLECTDKDECERNIFARRELPQRRHQYGKIMDVFR